MSLSTPSEVQGRLEEIESELASKENQLETAAFAWFVAKREREKQRALAFLTAEGTVAERNALADRETATLGVTAEARYEALRGVVRVMETRASVAMAILKAQARV